MSAELKEYKLMFTNDERKIIIAENLKRLRDEKGLNQQDVAEAIGLKLQTYSAYERGRSEAPAEALIRLAMFYEITLDELMQRDNRSKYQMKKKLKLSEADRQLQELKEMLAQESEETQAETAGAIKALDDLNETLANALEAIQKRREAKKNKGTK